MKKHTIIHNNTDVVKLWNLARHGLIDRRTVKKIFENDDSNLITFNSKYTYDKFKRLEYSASALYKD